MQRIYRLNLALADGSSGKSELVLSGLFIAQLDKKKAATKEPKVPRGTPVSALNGKTRLTTVDAGKILGITPQGVAARIKVGTLKARRVPNKAVPGGFAYVLKRSDVVAAKKKHGAEA